MCLGVGQQQQGNSERMQPVHSGGGGTVRSGTGAPVTSRFGQPAPIESRALADLIRAVVLRSAMPPPPLPAMAQPPAPEVRAAPAEIFSAPQGVALPEEPFVGAMPGLMDQPVPTGLGTAPAAMPDESWRKSRSGKPERLFPWMR